MQISWTAPPSPPSNGYGITVTSASTTESATTSQTSYTTSFQQPGVYSIRVASLSQHLPSLSLEREVTVTSENGILSLVGVTTIEPDSVRGEDDLLCILLQWTPSNLAIPVEVPSDHIGGRGLISGGRFALGSILWDILNTGVASFQVSRLERVHCIPSNLNVLGMKLPWY